MTVDLEELTDAFEDASAELNYFVDLETGDVILVSETLGFIEAGPEIAETDPDDRSLGFPGLNESIRSCEEFHSSSRDLR